METGLEDEKKLSLSVDEYDDIAQGEFNMTELLPSQNETVELLAHYSSYSELFVVVAGPEGSGKSVIAEAFISQRDLPEDTLLLKASIMLDLPAILNAIAKHLDLPSVLEDSGEAREMIRDEVKARKEQNYRLVVIVDQAELLDIDVLNDIGHLALLSPSALSFILFGRSEFENNFRQSPAQAPLTVVNIHPLTEEESFLLISSRPEGEHLTNKQLTYLHAQSGGRPARLLAGLAAGGGMSGNIEKAYVDDRAPPRSTPLIKIFIVIMLLTGFVMAGLYYFDRNELAVENDEPTVDIPVIDPTKFSEKDGIESNATDQKSSLIDDTPSEDIPSEKTSSEKISAEVLTGEEEGTTSENSTDSIATPSSDELKEPKSVSDSANTKSTAVVVVKDATDEETATNNATAEDPIEVENLTSESATTATPLAESTAQTRPEIAPADGVNNEGVASRGEEVKSAASEPDKTDTNANENMNSDSVVSSPVASESAAEVETPTNSVTASAVVAKPLPTKEKIIGRSGSDNQPYTSDESILLGISSGYIVQLLGTYEVAAAESFRQRWDEDVLGSLYMYRTQYNGRDWYVVVAGIFTTRSGALTAVASMPTELRAQSPWVRPVSAAQDALR